MASRVRLQQSWRAHSMRSVRTPSPRPMRLRSMVERTRRSRVERFRSPQAMSCRGRRVPLATQHTRDSRFASAIRTPRTHSLRMWKQIRRAKSTQPRSALLVTGATRSTARVLRARLQSSGWHPSRRASHLHVRTVLLVNLASTRGVQVKNQGAGRAPRGAKRLLPVRRGVKATPHRAGCKRIALVSLARTLACVIQGPRLHAKTAAALRLSHRRCTAR